jgi:hypothetical protein
MRQVVPLCAVVFLVTACATRAPSPPPAASAPSGPRIELPAMLGVPAAASPPELPAGALVDGKHALFDIAFEVDLRGRVIESRIDSTNRPDLADAMLAAHRQWGYAVATREAPCRIHRYRAVQTIELQQRDGGLVAQALPPRSTEIVERRDVEGLKNSTTNYREVLSSLPYPRAALLAEAQADFTVIVEFAADGSVQHTYPTIGSFDRFGFGRSAAITARRLKVDPAPDRAFASCMHISFRIV